MGQLVNVATAARKLGVTRVQLQQLIRSGELQTFEGQVDVELLKRQFPMQAINSQSMLERTKIIRESAYAERVRETLLSNEGELENQVKRLRVQLSVATAKAAESSKLMHEFASHIAEIRQTGSTIEKRVLAELTDWIDNHLNKSAS